VAFGTKDGGRDPVAALERPREVGRLTVADQPCHIAHRDRGLGQQLGGGDHPSGEKVLAERAAAELLVGALYLAGGAGERLGDDRERQVLAVATFDQQAREQIQPTTLRERTGTRLDRPASERHYVVEVDGDLGGDGSAAAPFDEARCVEAVQCVGDGEELLLRLLGAEGLV
jgi:hypothetical protein